ncbi:MAG: hypothetical protein ACO1TE_08980 [Prosthecobacter sp.]
MPSRPFLLATLGASALLSISLHAEVKLPPAISSHMVLQREMPVPIWGTAAAGEDVTVAFADQIKTTKAGADGQWLVKLDPLPASAQPRDLIVASGPNPKAQIVSHKFTDVLVGEVWLGSGQSNMAGAVRSYKGKDAALQKTLDAAPYPRIRLLKQGAPGWVEAVPAQVDGFSAILFAYGARLHAELGVPVGLMLGAVGGTPSGHWLTEDMFKEDAACQAQVQEFAKTYDFAAAMRGYERYMTAWKASAEKAKAEGKLPGREPAVPRQPGECNAPFGHLYVKHVQPYLPYAIRGVLWDQGEGGTAITGVDQFHAMGALIKGWRKAWAQHGGQADFPFLYVQKPSGGGTAWDMTNPTTINASPLTTPPAVVPRDIDGQARDVHIKIQQHPHTAMVTNTDLGGMPHLANKSGNLKLSSGLCRSGVYSNDDLVLRR